MTITIRRRGWSDSIAEGMRERELRRRRLQLRFQRALFGEGSLGSRLAGRLPASLLDYLRALSSAVIGFWVISWVPARFLHADLAYLLPAFGLFYSVQSAYYSYRLSRDPNYKLPKCRCAGGRSDDSAAVLRSKESSLFGIPNSLLAAALYLALLVLAYTGQVPASRATAALAVAASAWLGYVMVVRIGRLCANCVNMTALNLLLLAYLFW